MIDIYKLELNYHLRDQDDYPDLTIEQWYIVALMCSEFVKLSRKEGLEAAWNAADLDDRSYVCAMLHSRIFFTPPFNPRMSWKEFSDALDTVNTYYIAKYSKVTQSYEVVRR